ncbi:MAG: integrase core domain-containing protein [Solirubrobacterales bacterium]
MPSPTTNGPSASRPSCTSTPLSPARRCRWTAFTSAGFRARRASCGNATAIDVASAYVWAFLRSTHRNPSARHTAELCHLVASELKAAGWKLAEVTTDNGSEFRSADFGDAVAAEKATQRRIKAGRPNSNGCAERAQLTILEECWRPAFSRSLAPKITALRRDLDEYLRYYNNDRAHTGRLTKGRVPADIVFKARKMGTVR